MPHDPLTCLRSRNPHSKVTVDAPDLLWDDKEDTISSSAEPYGRDDRRWTLRFVPVSLSKVGRTLKKRLKATNRRQVKTDRGSYIELEDESVTTTDASVEPQAVLCSLCGLIRQQVQGSYDPSNLSEETYHAPMAFCAWTDVLKRPFFDISARNYTKTQIRLHSFK